MRVSNVLVEESFQFTEDKPDMLYRGMEIDSLDKVADYCKSIDEKIKFSDDLYEIQVQNEVSLCEYLYASKGAGSDDDRRRLLEMLSKKCQYKTDENGDVEIQEYEDFMHSCFPNSHFAKDIIREMRYIKDFPQNAKEITENLSVLDDEALKLYREHHANLNVAMDILTAKLIECSPDPAHVSELLFPFEYEECMNGEIVAREKAVACSPHLKLIRKDSDLRIYFEWCDKDVGNGEKVLIGRIGRHPY